MKKTIPEYIASINCQEDSDTIAFTRFFDVWYLVVKQYDDNGEATGKWSYVEIGTGWSVPCFYPGVEAVADDLEPLLDDLSSYVDSIYVFKSFKDFSKHIALNVSIEKLGVIELVFNYRNKK